MILDIEIDRIETWPSNLVKLFGENIQLLINFYEKEYEDRSDEINLHNPYLLNKNLVVAEAYEIINKHNFIGYHCARLLKNEIYNIKTNYKTRSY